MASTYSTNLALELIGTGDQSGTWGTTNNTNLGTLIEQAISGYQTQVITDGADTVITIPNGASGVARNMTLELTGALTAARNLIVPANKKLYFIYNNTTGGYAVTVKVSGQTGVSVPNGVKTLLVSNGTDVVSAVTYLANLTVGGNPTLSGGTANGVAYLNGSKVLTTGSALTFDGTNLSSSVVTATSWMYVTPAVGTNNALYRASNTGGTVYLGLDNSAGGLSGAAYALSLYHTGNYPIVFSLNSAEQMRLTSTGLGIGTNSPGYKLDVNGAIRAAGDGSGVGLYINTSAIRYITNADNYIDYSFGGATGGLQFRRGASVAPVLTLSNAGNVSINAPASGTTLTTTAVTNGIANLWLDTGQQANLTFAGGETTFGTTTSHVLNLQTAGTKRVAVSATGNVTINTPSSGSALTLSAASTTAAMTIYTAGDITTNGPSSYLRFNYNNNANSGGYIGYGGFANQLEIYNYLNGPISFITNSAARMNIGGSGNVTINAPSSGTALTVSGKATVGNANAIDIFSIKGATRAIRFEADTVGCSIAGVDNTLTGSYQPLYLQGSDLRFGVSGVEVARIDSSGTLLVGTASASFNSSNSTFFYPTEGYWVVNHANGTSTGTRYIGFGYNTGEIGSITQSGTTAVLYNTTSDQRLKENITDADSASDVIDAIKVRQFDWKSDGTHQRYGMIAQELHEVAPEAVHAPADPDDMMSVDYSKLVPMLVKEIQSLRQRLAVLEAKQ